MNTKVLLVDDEEQFVEVLGQRLQGRGFKVDTAFNGDDAIEFINTHDVDVVVLDVLMPGRDGLETLREIKRIKPITRSDHAHGTRHCGNGHSRYEIGCVRLSHEAHRHC